MITDIPDWAVSELKALYVTHTTWRNIKTHLGDLPIRLGRDIDAQLAYDVIHGGDRLAPCGKEKRFDGFWAGYRFCGNLKNCPCAARNTTDKRIETNMDRYGVVSPLQHGEFLDRARETNIERYGGGSALCSGEVREKSRETHIRRYGVDNYAKTESFKEKSKATNLERYGVEWSGASRNNRDKTQETVKAKYGVDYIGQSPCVKQKVMQTNHERYGAKTTLHSDHVKSVMVERYGGLKGNQLAIADGIAVMSNADELAEFISDKSVRKAAKDLGVGASTLTKYCGGHGIPLPRSSYEAEINAFIGSLGLSVNLNSRRPLGGLELDFHIPQHNLAIEFNGIYWHSSRFKDHLYHRRKYEACSAAGIRLLMINEDEWIEREPAIKSRIVNMLGQSPRGKGARKLTIRPIPARDANSFFDMHHIQGRTGTITACVGAHDGDELVAVMAFNIQRGTRAIELIRYCTDGKSYAGAFTRLFRRAVTEFDFIEVISFSDNRYSEGDVYAHNGFTPVGEIAPDYRYVGGSKTYHKSSFTKAKIAKRFDIDMSAITEKQAMEQLGYMRLYDCGKRKWQWNKH